VQLSSEVFAARRARWLAELSDALIEAGRLMQELDVTDASVEALGLCAQIEALRGEVDAMRLKGNSRDGTSFSPEWIKSPWDLVDPADLPKPTPPFFGAGWDLPIDV
jgi:hypothetical protein